MQGERGFTLLEVLVASTILSLVLAALYGVFSRTLASQRLAEGRAGRSRSARIVLLRLREDLQASLPLTKENSRFAGETRQREAFPTGVLSFVSLAQTPVSSTSHEGDVNEIGYALLPNPTVPGSYYLMRRVNLDPGIADPAADEALNTAEYPLLSQVRGLRFRFFDGRIWREEWGQDDTRNKLPRAVEATLYLQDAQAAVAEFSTVIDLPLATAGRLGVP
ncbi:MAG: prepilin-type N-terminal cleavage/methylation domain-containing protein [Deltaproteobacteria bacterium]|nr:prepilin-type N-terminal cleavage/methylation domain-containing protein [Deltaproteobacteria bacterium]